MYIFFSFCSYLLYIRTHKYIEVRYIASSLAQVFKFVAPVHWDSFGRCRPSSSAGFVDLDNALYDEALVDPSPAMLHKVLGKMSRPCDGHKVAPAATGASVGAPLLRLALGLVSVRSSGPALSRETCRRKRLAIFFFFNKCQTRARTQWLSWHMVLPACMRTTQTLANVRHHGG